MAKHLALFRLLSLALPFFFLPSLQAQNSISPSIDPAISRLAAEIAGPLAKAHVKKVIFADLKGPNGEVHPVGRWLADQLSDSAHQQFPNLQILSRPEDQSAPNGVDASSDPKEALTTAKTWARRHGAKVVVAGSFAKVEGGLGVSLSALHSSDSPYSLAQASGLVPISDAIQALSAEPIPVVKRAGVGGVGVPACIYCPAPDYPDEVRSAGYLGSVVLEVTITTHGRAVNIKILKDPGMGLGQRAIDAVRKWTFKPAIDTGLDGRPVAVICPIEVTFRLLK